MHANNEVGSFQPVEEIGKITKKEKSYSMLMQFKQWEKLKYILKKWE